MRRRRFWRSAPSSPMIPAMPRREWRGRDRPGERVHPGIESLLGQLGLATRLAKAVGARQAGIWIEWGGPRRFEPFGGDASGPWSGVQAWRADFDALLLTRAREV